MKYRRPFGSVPARTAGSSGMGAEGADGPAGRATVPWLKAGAADMESPARARAETKLCRDVIGTLGESFYSENRLQRARVRCSAGMNRRGRWQGVAGRRPEKGRPE